MKKIIFFIALVIVLIYCGYLFAVPQYHYYALKSDIYEFMSVAHGWEKTVKETVMDIVHQYDVPFTEKDVYLTKDNNRYYVKVSWEETVDVFTLYQKTYYFTIDTSKKSSGE